MSLHHLKFGLLSIFFTFRRSTVLDSRWTLLLYCYTHIGHFPFSFLQYRVRLKDSFLNSWLITHETNFLPVTFKSGMHTQSCLCDILTHQDLDINDILQVGIANVKFLECQIWWSAYICFKVTHTWNKRNYFGTHKVTAQCVQSLPPVYHSKHI
jgi:hypothetical protein